MKKFNLRQFGVGSLIRSPPLLSIDSKYLFTIGERCVYIWNVQNGELLRCFNRLSSSRSKDEEIVSIAFNPHNRLQLCVALNNGQIKIWDYQDHILIHTIDIGMEILEIFSIVNRCLFLFTKTNNVSSLNRIDSLRHYSSLTSIFSPFPCQPRAISFDQKGDVCLFINVEGTILFLLDLVNIQFRVHPLSKANLSFHQKIVCAEIHPAGQLIALGSESGRILLLEETKEKKDLRTVSSLHWHSLSVLCLTFSWDGSFLFSGGHECVLVKWILNTTDPTFLPRLGAPIKHLLASQDQTFIVSSHSNNTVHLISSHFSVQQTIAGMNETFLPTASSSSLPAGMHLFRRGKGILMNSGQPGHLQLISAEQGKLLFNLDLLGENYVSPTEMNVECLYTDIKRMSIDPTENWLVTFEERISSKSKREEQEEEEEGENQRRLRFWMFNCLLEQFELNTTITFPHGQQTLNQIQFHPSRQQLVTTGNDGFMKIWTLVQDNPITKRNKHWRCSSASTHRSTPSNALCFFPKKDKEKQWNLSSSFEHLVEIWTNQTNNNQQDQEEDEDECRYSSVRCLIHFDREDFVRSIHFSLETLFVSHQRLVNLWNPNNGQFLRSLPWHVNTIAQQNNLLAVFERNFLHLYSFVDGRCQSRKNSLFRRVTSALFIPKDNPSSSSSTTFSPLHNSRLIFAIPGQGLKTLEEEEDDDDNQQEEEEERQVSSHPLSELIIQSKKSFLPVFDELTKSSLLNCPKKKDFNEQLFSIPSYLLPSIDQYCLQALKQSLQSNRIEQQQQQQRERDSTSV